MKLNKKLFALFYLKQSNKNKKISGPYKSILFDYSSVTNNNFVKKIKSRLKKKVYLCQILPENFVPVKDGNIEPNKCYGLFYCTGNKTQKRPYKNLLYFTNRKPSEVKREMQAVERKVKKSLKIFELKKPNLFSKLNSKSKQLLEQDT